MRIIAYSIIAMLLSLAGAAGAESPAPAGPGNPFYAMDTSFNRAGLSTGQQLDLVKELGYAGIAWTEQTPEQMKATLAEVDTRGLKMSAIYCAAKVTPQGDLSTSPALAKLMETLAGQGTIIWLHIDGQGPPIDKLTGQEPLIAKLRGLADEAKKHGLRVAVYPHFGMWAARFGDAVRLAKLIDRPQFGVTFNLCHCLAAGDERLIPELLEEAGPVLFTATICGADSGITGPKWNRLIRPLGQGTFDTAIVLRALKKLNFTGPIGFQGFGIKGDARSILGPTMTAWRKGGGS